MQPNRDAHTLSATKHGKKRATILIMGPAGSGKTSFANLASGSTLQVASSATSCTNRIQATREFEVDGYAVTIIDTPGLNGNADTEALTSIGTYLTNQYQWGELVTGVIYIHPIRDEESPGDLKAFEEICGDEALQNAAIVTSKWGLDSSKHRRPHHRRERELMAGPFASFNNKGVHIFRHDRGQQSALEIIRYLLQKPPIPLQVQRKMIYGGLRLQHTGAGQILLRDLSTDHTKENLDMLRQPIRTDNVPEYGATQSRTKVQNIEVGLQKTRTVTGEVYSKKGRWDLGEVVVCFCCGAALYAFITILKHRAGLIIV